MPVSWNVMTANIRCSVVSSKKIDMNLVFHISEDGSEIKLKHCACSEDKR